MDKVKESWEYWGDKDPYYAVTTFDKFRKENLTEANKEDFFQSGFDHIRKLWEEIANNFSEDFKPRKGLDFGCGVGRLVVPLAEKCEQILGVDISDLMLEEAVRNCTQREIANADFQQSEKFINENNDKFDFIHSFIVFQHINPVQGEKIVKKIIESLNVDGIGVLHFVYANSSDDRNFWRFKVYRDYPIVNQVKNLVKGGNPDPLIPMYIYDLNKIFFLLQENDCHKSLVRFSSHGMNGILIIFQKSNNIDY